MISRYPALLLLLSLSGFLVVLDRGAGSWAALVAGSLLFWGAALLYSLPEEPLCSWRAAGVFAVAVLACLFCSFRYSGVPEYAGRSLAVSGRGRVVQERPWGGRWMHVIQMPQGKFCCLTFLRGAMKEGTELLLSADVVPLVPGRKNSSFDPVKYWAARGVFGELEIREKKEVPPQGWSLSRWRALLRERLLLSLPFRSRGYLLALWLGVRDPELAQGHRRWGTSHLLAVSGFHVGLVSLILFWLFPLFLGKIRIPLISLGMWGYVCFAGASPSALRAALMFQLVLVSFLAGRRGNSVNAVALAASLLLLWRPWWFWDLGWRLSVLAVLGITLLVRFPRREAALCISPVAWSVTAPPLVEAFGSVPLGGMAVNFLALPVYGVLFPLLALLGFLGLWHCPGAGFLLGGLECFLGLWHHFLEAFSRVFELQITSLRGVSVWGCGVLGMLLSCSMGHPGIRCFFCGLFAAAGMFFLYVG